MTVNIVTAVRCAAEALTWRAPDYTHWIEPPPGEAVQLGRAQDTYVGHMSDDPRLSVMNRPGIGGDRFDQLTQPWGVGP